MKTNAFTLGLVALATLALSTNLGFAQETSQESQSDVKVIDSKTTAKVVDGKVIISLADGNIRVIDLQDGSATRVKDGAKSSIVVEQKVEDDGTKQKRTGRAVIIGPDGKRQEIELDELPGLPGTAICGKAATAWK